MRLGNANFRIRKTFNGFVVEVKQRNWFRITYWTHFIPVDGMAGTPWYHSSYKHAMDNLLTEIKTQTNLNSRRTA